MRRPDSSSNEVEDYFKGVPQFSEGRSYRSLPGTPRETLRRNISFSPRIQFHDVWSATDYDRRGDVATCNRLTPLLAQQIKEELNTFKMVGERNSSVNISLLLMYVYRKWKYTNCQKCIRTFSNVTDLHDLDIRRS